MEGGSERKEPLSHEELVELTGETIGELVSTDPLLRDLPMDVTLDEVNAQLALHHGQSITVIVNKANGTKTAVVVPLKGRVVDLKKALRRQTNLSLKRLGSTSEVSWHYVWKNNHLVTRDGTRLEDDNQPLSQLGLTNRSVVSFVKRRRVKNPLRQRKGKS